MKVRGWLVLLVALVGSASGAGVSWGLPAAKPPPVPEGFVATPVKAAAFTFALPATWLALDPKSPQTTTVLQNAAARNPKLSSFLAQWESLRSSVKLWAIDAGATTFASNVLVLPTPYDKSLVKQPNQLEAALKAQMGTVLASLTAHRVKIAGVGAVQADAILEINGADGAETMAYATIYFLPTKKGVIDIDYTSGTPPASDTTLPTIVQSIRLS
jgi:hypothetical protein